MGKRILVSFLIFLLMAVLVLPLFAANVDQFLLRQVDPDSVISQSAILWKPHACWEVLLQREKALLIYSMATVCFALLLLVLLVKGSGVDSKSRMKRITPDIVTPCADGQGQYGTARWMTGREKRKCFSIWKIPRRNPELKALLKAGQADRKEIRHADIQLE